MSGSDGEDGRLEKSTTTTTTATTTVATITGERDIAEAMGDDDGGSTAMVMKRHCNDVIAVDSCTDSVWTCRDTLSDHENGDARVFPAVADYDPTGVRPRSDVLREPNVIERFNFNKIIFII